ncbi:MAG: hypothetical protein J3K34DRAFT_523385 [Monoraphidium minutum]|nr:MAG: hypothetical protein J3K34DRAFT_523385 [Monoraphidium minutum]
MAKVGAMPEMYGPVLAFAHLFAAFWLLRMLLIMYNPGSRGKAARGAAQGGADGKGAPAKGGGAAVEPSDVMLSPDQRPPPAVTAAGASATAPAPTGALARLALAPGGAGRPAAPHAGAGDADSSGGADDDASSSAGAPNGGARGPGVVPSKDSQIILRRLTTNLRPMALEWNDLGCAYPSGQGVKVVLQHVYGRADPREMLALMGPSGAGKSTLMDIISARKSVGRLEGEVLVNRVPRGPEFLRKTSYYDNFLPTMTVGETAHYYGSLLLPNHWGGPARRERVRQVLAAMGLSHTADTLVGGTLPGGILLRGLSGGERKRLSIAVGIISTPAVIFLDEPTSGLDSVMGYMQCMAHRGGHTVIASIHQPRAAIWAMFDTALVLSSGMLMYFGPCDGLVPWFSSLGYAYDVAMHGVPSDWVMDLVNKFYGKMIQTKDELAAASDAFLKSYLADSQAAAAEDGRCAAAAAAAAAATAPAAAGPVHPSAPAAAAAAPAATSPRAAGAGGAAVSTKRVTRFMTAQEDSFEAAGAAPARGAGAAGGAGGGAGGAQQAPLSAVKVAELQAVLDAHARNVEHGQRGSRGGGAAGLKSSLKRVATCGGGGGDVEAGGAWGSPPSSPGKARRNNGASWFRQFRVLLWRELLAVTRNPADVAGRMLIFTWISVLIGLIYYNLDGSLGSLRSRLNVLYVQPTIFLLLPYVYMSLYSADKQYYVADATARLYRPSAFYAAKQLAILPFAVLNVLVFSLILYGMAGLRQEALSVVLACAAVITPNQDIAFMVAIAWTAVSMLMSNFMVRFADMSQVWLSQLRYISAMAFAFEGFTTAEFKGGSYSCAGGLPADVIGYLPSFLPNTTSLQTPLVTRTLTSPGEGCVINLGAVLDYFNIFKPIWMIVVILAGYLGVLHLLTFGAYLLVGRKERR